MLHEKTIPNKLLITKIPFKSNATRYKPKGCKPCEVVCKMVSPIRKERIVLHFFMVGPLFNKGHVTSDKI